MTYRTFVFLGCLSVAACGGGDDDTGGTAGTTTTGGGACAEIVEFHPQDGAADVYYRTTVEFTVTPSSGSETIEVTSGGAAVAGSVSYEGDRVIFTPSEPLTPSTSYETTLTWCNGSTSTSWTTNSIGAPVTDPAGLVDRAYSLDLATGRFVDPPGVGPLIQQQLDTAILIGVSEVVVGETLKLNGALADETGAQDECTVSIDFPVAADFSEDPYFVVDTPELMLEVEGIEINIENLLISGAFSADGSAIEGAVLAGFIDTRVLNELIGATADDENATCDLVAAFGVACEPCVGGGDFCLTVFVDDMVANEAAGVNVKIITEDDIAANDNCESDTTPTTP